MTRSRHPLTFLFVAVGATAFVALTGMTLPDPVAAHFSVTGAADGFMSRHIYVGLLIALVVGLPALLVAATCAAMGGPQRRIDLPDPGYWLAPERRASTLSKLHAGVLRFGALLMVFLCYVHWLVVRANASVPVRLAPTWLFAGLVVFLIVTVVQIALLLGRFRHHGT
ncbi:MAG: hypothetical protein JSR59_23310 [Proteobacteria bacterium]|nr:hypothetical protein [Pseudomonadota bacterium]